MAKQRRLKPYNQHQGIIYPRFYQYKKGRSDRNWILSRMHKVPKEKQAEIAEQYERLYLSQDRQAANKWLNDIYLGYRDAEKTN